MKMTYDQELLTIVMEEAAEIVQEASKCIRFGLDNAPHLEKEIGDFLCMLELLHQNDYISYTRLEEHIHEKYEKLKKYSNLIIEDEQ